MLVKYLMNKKVVTTSPEDSLTNAIREMSDNNIGCVVVNKNDKVVGILTERDVIKCLAQRNINMDEIKVTEVMTHYVISISPDARIEKAIELIEKYKIKKLPVLYDSTKLVGIITATDICLAEPKIIKKISELLSKDLI